MIYKPPKFCASCGQAFLWTENKLIAIAELTELAYNFDSEENTYLNNYAVDLVYEA